MNRNNNIPKICITTSYDENFAGIGDYSAMTIRLYAKIHRCEVHVSRQVAVSRPPAWDRVALIPQLFDQGYDFVLWIDADAVFSRYDVDIKSVIKDGKDLYLIQHNHPGHLSALLPNTGVMLVRNSAWSRNFFSSVWEKTDFIEHGWWENAAVLDLLGYRGHLGGTHEPDQDKLRNIDFLDDRWNHIPSICHGQDPIITHLAGMPRAVRQEAMPRLALSSAFRALETEASRSHSNVQTSKFKRFISGI